MIIFLSFLQGNPNHPIPAYSFWEFYIKNGIEEAGHSWIECPDVDWAEGLIPKDRFKQESWRTNAWQKTIEFLKENPADLFLAYLYPQQIDLTAIKEIKKRGIPIVNFFCDHVREFRKLPVEFSEFDLNWVPEKKAIKLYESAKYPTVNLPMPMWVDPKYRNPIVQENQLITFIGSKDIQRQLLFEELLKQDAHLPLKIYGSNWNNLQHSISSIAPTKFTLNQKIYQHIDFIKSQGLTAWLRRINQRNLNPPYSKALQARVMEGKPSFEEYVLQTRNSMLTIGINRFPSFRHPLFQPDSYSRLRDIEAPMLGACYLTEYTSGLEDMYSLENEIWTYKNAIDMAEKIRYLQQNDSVRLRSRVDGQKRALAQLSIPYSISKLQQAL